MVWPNPDDLLRGDFPERSRLRTGRTRDGAALAASSVEDNRAQLRSIEDAKGSPRGCSLHLRWHSAIRNHCGTLPTKLSHPLGKRNNSIYPSVHTNETGSGWRPRMHAAHRAGQCLTAGRLRVQSREVCMQTQAHPLEAFFQQAVRNSYEASWDCTIRT